MKTERFNTYRFECTCGRMSNIKAQSRIVSAQCKCGISILIMTDKELASHIVPANS